MTWRRRLARLGVLMTLCYALVLVLGACCSDRLIFPAPASSYDDSPGIIKLKAADGNTIAARYFENPAATYTILHSHGNGEDIGRCKVAYDTIRSAGFNVLAYDYPGYGASTGSASESSVYASIDAAYDYLTGTLAIPPERIILYGRSVGSGPSVDLATRRPVAGLVLEGAFTSAYKAVTRIALFPGDRFENLKKMPGIKCPVLVIHGQRDCIISPSHGRKLAEAAGGPVSTLWVEKAGHNNLTSVAGESLKKSLQDFEALVKAAAKSP